jgi:signal transduction histidine kinase
LNKGLKIIDEESDRLSRVMNRLLLAARITSGSSALTKEPLNIPALARKIVRRRRDISNQHHFKISFEKDLPPVMADTQMIEEVLDNLVDNAVKYSPEGSKITISGKRTEGLVRVTVSDEGIGIPEKGMQRLFERFYRVERGKGQVTKGLGLGLFICKTIIEAHGGKIEAASREGRGSQFSFTLPI